MHNSPNLKDSTPHHLPLGTGIGKEKAMGMGKVGKIGGKIGVRRKKKKAAKKVVVRKY